MIEKYYLDISIWIDIYEDRKGYNNKPLGEYALKLLCFIRSKNKILVISELLIKELEKFYSIEEINGMLTPFQDILQKIKVTKKQLEQANEISRQRNLPPGDVLHAILSRENNLILVTRDKHFNQLQDITKPHNPQLTIPHFKKTITQIPTTPKRNPTPHTNPTQTQQHRQQNHQTQTTPTRQTAKYRQKPAKHNPTLQNNNHTDTDNSQTQSNTTHKPNTNKHHNPQLTIPHFKKTITQIPTTP